MIGFLGTGLLGSAFVRSLLKKGEQVRVWNRTPAKLEDLLQLGAEAAATPSEAVAGLSRVHLVLSDDASVDEVLALAADSFQPGCFVIDHTTTSVGGARIRTQQWQERGIHYVHVPVFMGPSNALEGTGVMLLGGSPFVTMQVEPFLQGMTGKIIPLGEDAGMPAAIKLLGNMFLLTLGGGFSDMLQTASAMQVPVEAISHLFQHWNPGAMAPDRFARMAAQPFDHPSWELQMARKDARLMMEEAAKGRQPLTVIPAIANRMDQQLQKGYHHKDWTIISKPDEELN
jgi:3-hydroxyisobutyrate dehydrogenase